MRARGEGQFLPKRGFLGFVAVTPLLEPFDAYVLRCLIFEEEKAILILFMACSFTVALDISSIAEYLPLAQLWWGLFRWSPSTFCSDSTYSLQRSIKIYRKHYKTIQEIWMSNLRRWCFWRTFTFRWIMLQWLTGLLSTPSWNNELTKMIYETMMQSRLEVNAKGLQMRSKMFRCC